MYKRILVPTDGSELSNKAIKEAATLAKLCKAELLILHVREPVDNPIISAVFGFTLPPGQSVIAHKDKEEQDLLKAAGKISDSMDVTAVTTYMIDPSPFDAIVRTAKDSNCDLIVMASHGRRGLAGLLIGSETHKVLTHTTIPVLVVR